MVQDLTIKLARTPKETIETYKFRLHYDLQLTYRLKHEYNGRVFKIFGSLNDEVLFERSLEIGNIWQIDNEGREFQMLGP